MQRTLFIAVAAVAVILGAVLFFVLRPQTPAATNADPAVGARFSFGPADAKVTVVDFSNYLCGHCGTHANEVLPRLKSEYIDSNKIRYVFRDFPFTGQDSVIRAGEAAACAADNNLYYEFHEVLFRSQQQWGVLNGEALDKYFADVAGQLGMAPASFGECLSSGKKREGVLADQKAGTALGITGTPTFYVNGKSYTGARPYEEWKKILDAALEGKEAPESSDGSNSPSR